MFITHPNYEFVEDEIALYFLTKMFVIKNNLKPIPGKLYKITKNNLNKLDAVPTTTCSKYNKKFKACNELTTPTINSVLFFVGKIKVGKKYTHYVFADNKGKLFCYKKQKNYTIHMKPKYRMHSIQFFEELDLSNSPQ